MVHTARQQLAKAKRARAVTLRTRLGYTYQQVADASLPCDLHRDRDPVPVDCPLCLPRLYADRHGARKAIEAALAEDWALTEEDRQARRQELLASTVAVMARMQQDVHTLVDPGDRARAANAYARVADRLAKIIGADAPTRIVIDEELDAELEAAMAELMSTPTPAPEALREQP